MPFQKSNGSVTFNVSASKEISEFDAIAEHFGLEGIVAQRLMVLSYATDQLSIPSRNSNGDLKIARF